MDFLKSVTSKKALEMILSLPYIPKTDIAGVEDALNRVLAEDVISPEDIPPFSRSLVDGFAVIAKDTHGAKETNPRFVYLKGEIKIGENADLAIEDGECVRVSTGSMLPEGADSVVMQEYTRNLLDVIEITKVVHYGENICFRGDDFKKGDRILGAGKRLNYFDLGILSSIGKSNVLVFRKPTIGIVSTGDEIVAIDGVPGSGQIRDINRYTLGGLFRKEGFQVIHAGIARDDVKEISEKIVLLKDKVDIILISGGSSKGEKDYIIDSIETLGGNVLFHGINIKPGKPTIFASLWGKPLFGLPGHPGSCIMVAIRFVLPLLKNMEGEKDQTLKASISGVLTMNIPSNIGVEECVDVVIEKKDEGIFITPVFAKSSVISAFTKSSGFVVIPDEKEGYEKGEEVEVYFF
ncbi:MAG TPA: molybdopterin molybdotransferase MoeA [Syntrophorhabdaceae bacterium]|nr:molybdopterin molybdotransferase MoeA [Syntrophorhabdaceae bacterium]